MSERRDENQSAQEMPVVPADGQIDGQVEDEDIKSLLENPVDEGNSQLNTEANFRDTSGLLVNPLEPGSAEPTSKDGDVLPELHTGAEVPVLVDQTTNASDDCGVLEVKNGEESELANTNLQSGSTLRETDVKADHPDKDQVESGNTLFDNGSELLEADVKAEHLENNQIMETPLKEEKTVGELLDNNQVMQTPLKEEKTVGELSAAAEGSYQSFTFDDFLDGDDSGTEEEQAAFMKELENFYREKSMDFKPPKFYGEGLNCLKLWRAVIRLGGYDRVTSCKLWRQVGESFKPPKTCTTVSWSFRIFYEKALLEYEKHKILSGELQVPMPNLSEPMSVENQVSGGQASSSGRARRDAAARAMQGWHAPRILSNGEVGDPIIKDKSSITLLKRDKRDKHFKGIGSFKRKRPSNLEQAVKVARTKVTKPEVDTMVVDVGAPADWVKINVRRTKDCFEVYALVPGLLREEVQVQSDPAGRLIISGEPEQPDNPWGVTPFKKVVTLPSRIDPHQTSAVVTLHGQLFVRAPFEQPQL